MRDKMPFFYCVETNVGFPHVFFRFIHGDCRAPTCVIVIDLLMTPPPLPINALTEYLPKTLGG